MDSSIYNIELTTNKGEPQTFSQYKDKVLLIVNTASACGFTPQYEELQNLYSELKDKGFEVLAFPCNQFGKQEKGNNEEIASFCDLNFNISFPLFEKIEVNGDNTHPLFKHLKSEAAGLLGTKSIKWNFTKFLVNQQGEVVKRYAPSTKPSAIRSDIEALL